MTESLELERKKIVVRGDQPRQSWDEKALEQLTASVKSVGILEPLLVRKVGKKYELVAGERRLRAAEAAGLDVVPVIVKELTDDQVLEVQIIENMQREDLNAIEEARAIGKLLELKGCKQGELAEILGRSQPWVSNRLRLLELPKRGQDAVISREISPKVAVQVLAVKSKARQQQVVAEAQRQLKDYGRAMTANRMKDLVDSMVDEEEREAALKRLSKGAEHVQCPKCGRDPDDVRKVERTEAFTHRYGWNDGEHQSCEGKPWSPKTGEPVLTKDQKRWAKLEAENRKRVAQEAVAKRKARGSVHVATRPAWIHSRATIVEWFEALSGVTAETGVDHLSLRAYGREPTALHMDVVSLRPAKAVYPAKTGGGGGRDLSLFSLPDGSDYKTTILVTGYRSGNRIDNIGLDGDAAQLEKIHGELLAFQRKVVGVPQKTKDYMIPEVDGLKLGAKVKVTKDFETKSYQGATAEVVGFWHSGAKTAKWIAVLNFAKANHYIHPRYLEVQEDKKTGVARVPAPPAKAKSPKKGKAKSSKESKGIIEKTLSGGMKSKTGA